MAGGKNSLYFLEREIPIVLINNHYPGNNVHWVGIANADGAKEITSHLLDLGHLRIGYVGNSLGGQANKERYRGYRAALRKAGIPHSADLIALADSSLEGGYRGMQELLRSPDSPTALFCFDDITAYGACKAIRDAGKRVPQDISVAGFDDVMFSSYFEPSLTTIRQPMREMGQCAMHLLLELIVQKRQNVAPKKSHVLLPGQLMVRQSTARFTGRGDS
jgi:DNA-binding LacI/PurR family transcriptional regulator